MRTVIRSCRNMERSRRCLRRHAAPRAAGGCPLVSAIDGYTEQGNANLSEPVVVVVVVVVVDTD